MKKQKANGSPTDSRVECLIQKERAIIGELLERPALWDGSLSPSDFRLSEHRKILKVIRDLNSLKHAVDFESVAMELGESADIGYLSELRTGAVPEYYAANIRAWNAIRQRIAYHQQIELMGSYDTLEEQQDGLERLKAILDGNGQASDWRTLFHTREEITSAPPVTFRISQFLQEDSITLVGALAGNSKTWLMLSMVKALLTGEPLFGYDKFTVPCPAKRVVYLCPESSLGPFVSRLRLFDIERLAGNGSDDRLCIQTLTARQQVKLNDPKLLTAAEGADVYLDTAVRFAEGDENSAEANRPFANLLFQLLARGARSVTGAHHAPKGFETAEFMTLENILRGSGDLGAMISTCWGLRQVNAESNRLFVQCCKARDFEAPKAFLLEGRPHIDDSGNFQMVAEPGTAGELRDHLKNGRTAGRPESTDKDAKIIQILELRAEGKSEREIQKLTGIAPSTFRRWLYDYDRSQKN